MTRWSGGPTPSCASTKPTGSTSLRRCRVRATPKISTVDGHPHGHILYSWNSGYWWLRKEIRRRLGQTGDDPVDRAVDQRLGVTRERGCLRLDPDSDAGGKRTGLLPPAGAGLTGHRPAVQTGG